MDSTNKTNVESSMARESTTFKGVIYSIKNFDPDKVRLKDIAHSLACINRYNGHTRVPYSVAEHCVRMSQPELPGDPLTNLLHDAAEAYLGDIIWAVKNGLGWWYSAISFSFTGRDFFIPFKDIEEDTLRLIYEGLGLSLGEGIQRLCFRILTKAADRIMAITEIRDLLPSSVYQYFLPHFADVKPLPGIIEPWGWKEAEERFLVRFEELTSG
jgi:hypothetical protein